MENIEKQLDELEQQLIALKQREKERKEQTNIGVISIIEDRLKMELLLNANDFSEEHIERLTQITNDLQDLLLDVYKDVKTEKEGE